MRVCDQQSASCSFSNILREPATLQCKAAMASTADHRGSPQCDTAELIDKLLSIAAWGFALHHSNTKSRLTELVCMSSKHNQCQVANLSNKCGHLTKMALASHALHQVIACLCYSECPGLASTAKSSSSKHCANIKAERDSQRVSAAQLPRKQLCAFTSCKHADVAFLSMLVVTMLGALLQEMMCDRLGEARV